MLFEDSTLLAHQADSSSPSPSELVGVEHFIDLIDAALRLALTDLSTKALTGKKITEKSSFKHLDDICPAMWSPGHLEVLFLRSPLLVLTLTMQSIGSCFQGSFPTHHQPRNFQFNLTTSAFDCTQREAQRDCPTRMYHFIY